MAADTGERRWQFDLGDTPHDWFSSPAIVAGDSVYVTGPFGTVYAIEGA